MRGEGEGGRGEGGRRKDRSFVFNSRKRKIESVGFLSYAMSFVLIFSL